LVLKSAVECTATVLMPSSRQARRMRSAISPRLAMTTFSIIAAYSMMNSGWPNSTGSPFLASMAVTARLVGFDLIHHLHGFDDAENLADFDLGADLDEGLAPGEAAE
jgi:hypothetical protein